MIPNEVALKFGLSDVVGVSIIIGLEGDEK